MRIINTDTYGGDYPDEKFVDTPSLTKSQADQVAAFLNEGATDYTLRWHAVVPDDYQLQPGFEP